MTRYGGQVSIVESRIPVAAVGIRLKKSQIEAYLKSMEDSGRSPHTRKLYQRDLLRFYDYLPEEKIVKVGTLAQWQEKLREDGYSVKTINICNASVNGLVLFLGHRELQADRLREEETVLPELTRAEYLRLLSAARMQGDEQTYLLVKVFGTIGLSVGELENLTAEAVQEGKVRATYETLRIPAVLREELLHYIGAQGISSGPVFVTRTGKRKNRIAITTKMKRLCQDARVSEEKTNPRCLKKLCQATRAGIRDTFSLLVEQAYDRMLEKEQSSIGWEQE